MRKETCYGLGFLSIVIGLVVLFGANALSSHVILTSPEEGSVMQQNPFGFFVGVFFIVLGGALIFMGVREQAELQEGLENLERKLQRQRKKEDKHGDKKGEGDGS